MGAAEARALWQRTASRCFVVHEDAKMAPRLACSQHHSSTPEPPFASNFSSTTFVDSSDFSSDTKWWLKGSSNHEEITNSFFEDINCKKLHEFVDLTATKEQDYSFIKDTKVDYSFYDQQLEENASPWWRINTERDELARLVATKSLGHHHNIQNCDLPPPQKVIHNKIHCTNSEKSSWKQGSLSYSSVESKNTSGRTVSNELNKGELLEALRHSQTRAREAEKAAKEACAEKEHLITLLLRQASQILAYKQWFKLLEMEALYLQMKMEENEIKGVNLKRKKQRKNKKMGEFGRYMVAFALGFSLIGAGLFLGWTVGWLFPF